MPAGGHVSIISNLHASSHLWGSPSGAIGTNTLLALYKDVFKSRVVIHLGLYLTWPLHSTAFTDCCTRTFPYLALISSI